MQVAIGNAPRDTKKMKQEEITAGETGGRMHRLANLIVFDPVNDDGKQKAKDASITLYDFKDVVAKGKERIA